MLHLSFLVAAAAVTPAGFDFGHPLFLPGLTFAALIVLASLLASVAKIFDVFRRKPPLEEIFATKAELSALEQRFEKKMDTIVLAVNSNRVASEAHFGELGAKLSSIERGSQSTTSDIMRALGRLEGKSDHKA